VTNFLERDLPALGYRMSPERLRKLWTMLTHVHGNVLNPTDLARSLGVSHHTVNAHLDVLEGAFMIRRLQPHFANIQKRLTKSPKVYVRDTGLLHFLAGLESPSQLETWNRRGASFEVWWSRSSARSPRSASCAPTAPSGARTPGRRSTS